MGMRGNGDMQEIIDANTILTLGALRFSLHRRGYLARARAAEVIEQGD
jgi:hypothetical protein